MASSSAGFQRMADGSTVDLLAYVRAATRERTDVEVLVGSDSHNHGQHRVHHHGGIALLPQRCAVIYRREKHPKVSDMWTRLWGEVERSLSIADLARGAYPGEPHRQRTSTAMCGTDRTSCIRQRSAISGPMATNRTPSLKC
ncbi:MAG: hypothetical protein IPG92_09010 [Flavobacteriales bacterium]|nr:hypothetical protein [Flavobacteriales bacterium]